MYDGNPLVLFAFDWKTNVRNYSDVNRDYLAESIDPIVHFAGELNELLMFLLIVHRLYETSL